MCGITGALWTDPSKALDADSLRRMTDVLRHRGPDDEGSYCSGLRVQPPYPTLPGIALGHRRLAIIDPASNRQPVYNEDDTIWAVFNGEIYNYVELRKRLEGSGHTFRTGGDSETLVHLYEDEGVEMLEHLNGMFAFALWDQNRGRLLLARDRLGQKPLVYRLERGRLLFASELKSLLEAPDVPREIDPSALDEYLTYQYVPHPNTIFRGIRKLPPAHYAVYESGTLRVLPYWKPDFNRQIERPLDEAADELRSLLASSVQLRMQSDVPLGAFLSGGVDSSIVVALMQESASQPVKTFSIGFSVREYDETSYARQVAEHVGTEHHEFHVEPSGIEILPRLMWYYDEPFGDSSAVPTYYVSKLTREHVTVAVSGDGGDELFAGYDRYLATKLGLAFDRFPWPMRALLANRFWQQVPSSARQKNLLRRWKRLVAVLALAPERRYAEWITIFNEARRAELYSDDFLEQLPDSDPLEFLYAAFARCNQRDGATAASLADVLTYLPCDLLTKVDVASMANGLECRQPFLDHRVVELAAAMPLSLKLRGRRGKRVLRRAFGGMIPASTFRRAKMGFSVPLDHWFRSELKDFARDVLLDPSTLGRGYFRPEAVERLIDEHVRGTFDHAPRLWSLLVLELWQRQWLDGGAVPEKVAHTRIS